MPRRHTQGTLPPLLQPYIGSLGCLYMVAEGGEGCRGSSSYNERKADGGARLNRGARGGGPARTSTGRQGPGGRLPSKETLDSTSWT